MNKIIQWCQDKNILLTDTQLMIELPNNINIIKVFSYYTTKFGSMFYIKTKNNKFWFLHLLLNGKFTLEDGYDGGDLSRYKKGKRNEISR